MKLGKSERPLVEIKGFGGGLGLILDDSAPFAQIEQELKKLLQRPDLKGFVRESDMVLKSGERHLSSEEFRRLQTLLKQEGGVKLQEPAPVIPPSPPRALTESEWMEAVPSKLSVASPRPEVPVNPVFEVSKSAVPLENAPAEEHVVTLQTLAETTMPPALTAEQLLKQRFPLHEALIIRQTLRSGQRFQTEKSVILLGDLNAGAEIESDGDIIVLGTLRGKVCAGAMGNRKAFIFALKMQPTQVRIADVLRLAPPEEARASSLVPELAMIEEGEIVMDTFEKFRW